jgi:hypothetical protein
MTEGNSCYRGGKPGMSDAFAAALWAADYMLELASLGCAGVNLHGGSSAFLTAGLGGHTPGLDAAKKPQQVRSGYYSPIRTEPGMETRAMPVYYGMILANQLAGGRVMRARCDVRDVNASVYAARRESSTFVAVLNKDPSKSLELKVKLPSGMSRATVARLRALSLEATDGVTFEGAEIGLHARWSPRPPEHLNSEDGTALIRVPAASAALLTLT